MSTLGPIVVEQLDRNDDPIDLHVFPDGDAFLAWLDSQEHTVYLTIQPREEVIHQKVELSPQQPYEPVSLDFCPSCGLRIADFQEGGYEDESGQRGHLKCRNITIQRRNAAMNRANAERLRNMGEDSMAEHWYRLADEADAWADAQETD